MARITKKQKNTAPLLVNKKKKYSLQEAITLLQSLPKAKFDESLEISLVLGIDPKKSDQQVRGVVSLPHGTGKKVRILVFAKAEKMQEAKEAGAEYVGSSDLIEKVQGGWTDFDAVITTPDMMREVGRLGKVLGPRGLMPTLKSGTVTPNVAKAVTEIKAGQIVFKVDKKGVINNSVGKVSFSTEKLIDNVTSFIEAICKAKPSSTKGVYLKTLHIASTMGAGFSIDSNSLSLS